MAYRVKIIGVDGKYAVAEDGTRLRIIGDAVTRGYVYTDGVVAYGYTIKSPVPIMHRAKGKKKVLVDILFDAMMTVLDSTGLVFVSSVYGDWRNCIISGAYPYRYMDYDSTFTKKCTLSGNASYILGSDKLFTIDDSAGNLIILHDVINNKDAYVYLPSYNHTNIYYDVGRSGKIALCAKTAYGDFQLSYIDGVSVQDYSQDDFKTAFFATGDFTHAQSASDISVYYPKDINVDDNGYATCTVVATDGWLKKKYKVEFHSYLNVYNYDFAECGDATGDFREDDGTGTVSVGNYTFSAMTGTKVTVTDDYIFVCWNKNIGSYSTQSGITIDQYDRNTGTLLESWDSSIYSLNNTRLDLYYIDDLLRLWHAGEVIDVDKYFDTQITVVPLRFDARMNVVQ